MAPSRFLHLSAGHSPVHSLLMNSPAAHRRIKVGVDIRPSPNRCVGQVKCSASVFSSRSGFLCRPVHVSGTSKSLRDCARVCLCPLLHPGNTTNSANLFYPLLVNEPIKIVPVCHERTEHIVRTSVKSIKKFIGISFGISKKYSD